jgi:hypothetical protein
MLTTHSQLNSYDFLLGESVPGAGKANYAFYNYQIMKILEKSHEDRVKIISLVGDGLKMQY